MADDKIETIVSRSSGTLGRAVSEARTTAGFRKAAVVSYTQRLSMW